LTARLYAKDFILKNTEESAQKVRDRIAVTAKLIDEGQSLFTRPDAIETMNEAKESITIYQDTFNQVTELVKQRNAVVDQLNTFGPLAEKDLTKIMKSAYDDNDASASFHAGTDLRSLLLARLYSSKFLVDNTQASADRANKELADFEDISGKLLAELQNPTRRKLANNVVGLANEYKVAFNQVVGIINTRNGLIKGTLDVLGPKMADATEQLKLDNKALQDELGPRATASIENSKMTAAIVSVIAIVLGAVLAFFIGRMISRPIVNMTNSMNKLAGGDMEVEVPALGQRDEIGKMADALLVFKEAAIEKVKIEAQAAEERNMTEEERADREQRQKIEADKIQAAVDELGRNLKKLADGDLTLDISSPFTSEMDGLRVDFNDSISKIHDTLLNIANGTKSIEENSKEMMSSSDDLSRRTEQQAASLEETSAALEEITSTVQETSSSATEAAEMANQAKVDTDNSSVVVKNAVSAMEGIEKASSEISNIINVIDEIAFQTNLLALNAGVEAARAGEAGKGFAVVAQEVRELAQRAADAAKQIKELISKSSVEVENGVELVKATGESLEHISVHVTNVNEKISMIARAASEQLAGIKEVNTAVSQMDQVTQQNAAMVEESTAVTHRTAEDVNNLSRMISAFKLNGQAQAQAEAAQYAA
jgi:methyl-accepting chemotaxis protein